MRVRAGPERDGSVAAVILAAACSVTLVAGLGCAATGPEGSGSDGSIFVADGQASVIRMFTRDGEFVRNIGREGQGPGEFVDIMGLEVVPDGRLAVWDARAARLTFFDTEGELLGSLPVPSTVWGDKSLRYDQEGNLYVRAVSNPDASEGDWGSIYLKLSPEGEVLDEIPLPDVSYEGRGFALQRPAGVLLPFVVHTRWAWSPLGYLVVGRNDEYRIELRRPGGTTYVQRDVQPTLLNPDERAQWQAWAEYVEERYREMPGPDYDVIEIPERKPFFRDVYTGEEGRIWVHRYVTAEEREPEPREPDDPRPPLTWLEPPTFDVFDPDGTFLGTVVLPPDTRILHWDRDRLWAVHTDQAGVERVERFRIEPALE